MTTPVNDQSVNSLPNDQLLEDVARYYTAKLSEHGATPRGVDWNGQESQYLRFEQLTKVIDIDTTFSINDLGCGYGALYDFMKPKYSEFSYVGYDVSETMVDASRKKYHAFEDARFIVASVPLQSADYGIASGILNVRLGYSDVAWRAYVDSVIAVLDRTSRRGFSFNCLTAYSDADRMRADLFYADPCELFDHCKRQYSRNVALLHDYNLYEFTILVRKPT